MLRQPLPPLASSPSVEFHLLGLVEFESTLALQRRLVYEIGGRDDGQISVLLCEHPPTISIGRLGSRGDVRVSARELAARGIEVHWISRGGGALLHLPGQLAVYVLVPLKWRGWTVGEFLARLDRGLAEASRACGAPVSETRGDVRLAGRRGQFGFCGIGVKDWITCHGAFVNVAPPMRLFRWLDTDPISRQPASSLQLERQQPIKMAAVRSALIASLAAELGPGRYHIHTGHPLLNRDRPVRSRGSRRAV